MADPGTPWLPMMAAGLARAGLLHTYAAPFAFQNSSPRLLKALPDPLRRYATSMIANRAVPDVIDASAIRRRASFLEAFTVLAHHAGPRAASLSGPSARLRALWFDRQISRLIEASDSAVVCIYGAALRSFQRARSLGVTSLLDFPIMHYRFAEALLQEEAELQPSFADTLQFHQFPPEAAERMDAEMAAAHRILVPSEVCRRTFEDAGVDRGKVLVLPYGVDTDLFRPPEKPRSDGVFRVIFVGQITQRKGISYLLEGFRRAALPRSELVLVGRPWGTGAAWRQAGGVRHINHVPRRELPRIYASADVFVMPSLVEGCVLTAIEAMACGLPVIVSDNALGGIVEDGVDGWVVPIRNTDAIASRLTHLHENPSERWRVGQAARMKALDYSWERYGERAATLIGALR